MHPSPKSASRSPVAAERLAAYREIIKRRLDRLRAGKQKIHVPPLVGLYRRPPGSHFHAAPEIFVQEGGVTVFDCPGGKIRLQAGEICVMPRGIPHFETRSNTRTNFEVMVTGHYNFGFHIHSTWIAPSGEIERMPSTQLKTTRGRTAFRYLDEIAAVPSGLSESQRGRFIMGCLEVFFLTILSELGGDSPNAAAQPNSTLVTEAEKFARWRLTQPSLTVATLAAALGVSADHLAREFRRERGITPKAWIISERLALARTLLVDHNYNIAEVGYACGFNSAPYFVNLFRRRTGITPSVFRATGFRK